MADDDVLLTPEVLRNRLNAGLAIAGGARGSLAKAVQQLQQQPPTDDAGAATTDDNTIDLQLLQIEMTKLFLIQRRNEQEIKRLKEVTEQNTPMEDDVTLDELRQQRVHVAEVASCLAEYEALAKVIVDKHSVSEHTLQLELKELDRQIDEATRNCANARGAAKIRAAQFHTLQQCLNDLKCSLSEPLKMDAKEIGEEGLDQKSEPAPMDVDKEDDEEEGELYGDLDTSLI